MATYLWARRSTLTGATRFARLTLRERGTERKE